MASGSIAPAPPTRRRWVPFWVLQLTELVVAFVFVDISVHVSNGGLLVGSAVAFAALALTAQGPLGIFRICRPWLHLTLMISVAAVVAAAPVIPALRPDIEGIIVVEFGAIGLLRLATLTDMHPPTRARRSSTRRSDPMVIDATATVTPDEGAPAHTETSPTSPGGATARWAGRAAGSASTSGRRALAKHRPEAEAQVKRAIRGAGRLTGRITTPVDKSRSGRDTEGGR